MSLRQRPFILPVCRVLLVLLAAGGGCRREKDDARPPTTAPAVKTVASLVPAATDLILAMRAGNQLVAVSTYDLDREGTAALPRVGDYQSTDWEKIRALRPAVMIRQFAPDRVPEGLRARTRDLGIELLNVRINTLGDVFDAIDEIGRGIDQPAKSAALKRRIGVQIDSVRARAAGEPRVGVLLVRDESGLALAGTGTFLDDLLIAAGGRNSAASLGNPYPTIDSETLRAMDPEVIIQLLPGAPPQMLDRAAAFWKGMPTLKAVRDRRIYTLTDWYVIQPGAHVGDVAEEFFAALHPTAARSSPSDSSSTAPSTRADP